MSAVWAAALLAVTAAFGPHSDDGASAATTVAQPPYLASDIPAFRELLKRIGSSNPDELVATWMSKIGECRDQNCVQEQHREMLNSVLSSGHFSKLRTKDGRNELIVVPLDSGSLAVSLDATNGATADGGSKFSEYEIASVATPIKGGFLIPNDVCPLILQKLQRGKWTIKGRCTSPTIEWWPAGFGAGIEPRGFYRIG